MSKTANALKRPYAEALRDAEAFRALFPIDSYERWEIAGSVRRQCPLVGDVEHVIQPRHGTVLGAGLFPTDGNLLWAALDRLLVDGQVTKHVYSMRKNVSFEFQPPKPGEEEDEGVTFDGEPVPSGEVVTHGDGRDIPVFRWGDKYRGVDFRGFNHEIFCADDANWGNILLIRTGPASFCQTVVTRIKGSGRFRQVDGHLIEVASGRKIPVQDERVYLRYAGMGWFPPEDRK